MEIRIQKVVMSFVAWAKKGEMREMGKFFKNRNVVYCISLKWGMEERWKT